MKSELPSGEITQIVDLSSVTRFYVSGVVFKTFLFAYPDFVSVLNDTQRKHKSSDERILNSDRSYKVRLPCKPLCYGLLPEI